MSTFQQQNIHPVLSLTWDLFGRASHQTQRIRPDCGGCAKVSVQSQLAVAGRA